MDPAEPGNPIESLPELEETARKMKIHEYQAKRILEGFGVPVPKGEVIFAAEEAAPVGARFEGDCILKAQVHSGGRGEAGGVKRASSPQEVEKFAGEMLGMTLTTRQTGSQGRKVRRLLVEEAVQLDRELYLSILVDRSTARPLILASGQGGMEIEELAKSDPEKVLRVTVDPRIGLRPFQGRQLAYRLGMEGELVRQFVRILEGLYRMFEETDASLLEINPLVVTGEGILMALDAKLSFDDNALFRHPELRELRDPEEEDPLEIEASKHGLNYIRLEGNVGCMVNGAGLAMATMDIIQAEGGHPANFLDVGGGASSEQVANGFRILLSDRNVRSVLINIFGGIVRCDRVATGVVDAVSRIGVKVPIVVRFEGTNAEEGRRILEDSEMSFTLARGMQDAARKAVQLGQPGDDQDRLGIGDPS